MFIFEILIWQFRLILQTFEWEWKVLYPRLHHHPTPSFRFATAKNDRVIDVGQNITGCKTLKYITLIINWIIINKSIKLLCKVSKFKNDSQYLLIIIFSNISHFVCSEYRSLSPVFSPLCTSVWTPHRAVCRRKRASGHWTELCFRPNCIFDHLQ